MTKHSIFISYRRSDSSDVTGRIYDRLTAIFPEESVFKDVDSIPIGVDFREHLERAVSQCEIVLAIIGQDWLWAKDAEGNRRLEAPEDYVHIELESALRRNIPIVPVLVRGATMPAKSDLPPSLEALAYRNATLVRSDPDFKTDVSRLIDGIQKHFDANQVSPIVSIMDQTPQYPSPQSDTAVSSSNRPHSNENLALANSETSIEEAKLWKKQALMIGTGIAAIIGVTGFLLARQAPQTVETLTPQEKVGTTTFNPLKTPSETKEDSPIGGGSSSDPTPTIIPIEPDYSPEEPDYGPTEPEPSPTEPDEIARDPESDTQWATISGEEGSKNIRSGPGTDYGEVHLAYPGDRVEILDTAFDSGDYPWHLVRFPESDAEGWIAGQLLEFD